MNTLKSRTINKLALIALLFAVALPLVPKVDAQGSPFCTTTFTNASLTGIFGYSSDGFVVKNGKSGNATDLVGVMWFDGLTDVNGNGTFEFHDTLNDAGIITQRGTACDPIVGTYQVNGDGTGTMQWVNPSNPGPGHTRAFAIVDGGNELQFGSADDQSTNRGVAKKQ